VLPAQSSLESFALKHFGIQNHVKLGLSSSMMEGLPDRIQRAFQTGAGRL
jgi:hypothetical protein